MQNIDTINILYNDIYLTKIKLDKSYSLNNLKSNLPQEIVDNYRLSVIVDKNVLILKYDILESYLLDYKIFNINLINLLGKDDKKIINYIDVLKFISDTNFIDNTISTKQKKFFISYASIISQRNLEIVKILFRELKNNNNQLVANFLLRDIIENIKLYLYFLRGAIKEEIINNSQESYKKEIVSEDVKNKILKTLSNENTDWNYDIKKIINDNPSLNIWKEDLKKIEKINKHCNSNIHKLGLTKILPDIIKNSNERITIDDICFCIRFFITLLICYDSKEISSSDYLDYLEMDMKPPENSQYWVAPIIQNFIDNEYNSKEKAMLKDKCYMDII